MTPECNKLDAFLTDDLPADEAAHFVDHLAECEACREATDEQRWIDDLLQSPIRLELEPVAFALVELSRTTRSQRRQRVRFAACGLAAAAMLLIAFGWWELNRQASRGVDGVSNGREIAARVRAPVTPSLKATFAGGADVIVVPVESRHPDVTIVRIYPTYRPRRENQTAAANPNPPTKSNWYDHSYGG